MYILPTIYIKSCRQKKKRNQFTSQTQIARENKKDPFFFIGRNLEDSPSSFEEIDRTNPIIVLIEQDSSHDMGFGFEDLISKMVREKLSLQYVASNSVSIVAYIVKEIF